MRIRLNDTPDQNEAYAAVMRLAFDVVNESEDYADPGRSTLARRFLDLRLKPNPAAQASTADFFEAGHDYTENWRPYTAPELHKTVRCVAVITHPTTGEPHAFGFMAVNDGWAATGMTPDHWSQGWHRIGASEAGA